ncbi:VOC family protein [Streptomyces xinghaiensis]|uniref:VOC family protein n=1 Tax=Streptomyces xinghaiensis TaxID=1038928 RepID=UPI0002FCCBF5|nr:VOC family protein [Streptomyces xinghaiensis]MZE76230.1 VOC family protein [Streptomyces sp. SID5475]
MIEKGFTTCLWFDGRAEEAAQYYTSVFEDGRIGKTSRYTEAGPGPAGSVVTVDFEINGQKFVALNGGPEFSFTEAISFQITCENQAEVDHYWDRLTEGGGQEVQCGWVKDRFGVSWQIVPAVLLDMVGDPDPEKAKRATEAMLGMKKLDIAELRKAYEGA